MSLELKEKILAVGIALTFVMFVAYGINTFYEEPKFDNFCSGVSYDIAVDSCPNESLIPKPVANNEESCWCVRRLDNANNEVVECRKPNPEYSRCRKEYEWKKKSYNKIVFIITVLAGVVALIAGAVFIKLESVGSGIMAGGVLTILYGSVRYWRYFEDLAKFLTLGLALAILIWVGYKKFNKK